VQDPFRSLVWEYPDSEILEDTISEVLEDKLGFIFLKIQIPNLYPTSDLNFKILYSYRIKQNNLYTKFNLKNFFNVIFFSQICITKNNFLVNLVSNAAHL